MNPFKLLAALISGIAIWTLGGAGLASAANESATIETSLIPRGGKLYKEVRVPVNVNLRVDIITPDSSPTVTPLKKAVLNFPTDMTYNPNNSRTPVCTDQMLNEQANLAAGVAAIVDHCPKSVVGIGTSDIYLAKVHSPATLIGDPQLVIFNGGRDSNGDAQMKIYGYSKATNYGILMKGSLTPKGIQSVFVPVLSNDSAVKNFVFNLPGAGITVEDPSAPGGTRVVKGLDPEYVRAKCSTGQWVSNGSFTLGERAFPSGTDTGPETVVQATQFTDSCTGLAGRARLGNAKANGPKSLRKGSRKVFKVRVKNNGTATAKRVRFKVGGSGRGQARTGNIAPGATRMIRVPVKVTGRKGSRARFVFRITANGAATRAVARGRVLG